MKTQPSSGMVNGLRTFDGPGAIFSDLDVSDVGDLLATGSDVILVLSEDGRIDDLAFRDPVFEEFDAGSWIGRDWSEIVTPESVEKVDALLRDASSGTINTTRQVNHPGKHAPDLPVRYTALRHPGNKMIFAFGDNQSAVAKTQTRLVQSQMELEVDYRALRDSEARYRTIFQMARRPVLVVNGSDLTVIDANPSAEKLFNKEAKKLRGDIASNLLDRTSRKDSADLMTEARLQGKVKTFETAIAYSGQQCAVSVEPFRENGRNNLIVKFERVGTVTGLADSGKSGGLDVLNDLPDGVALIDSQGKIIDVNEQFLDLAQALNKDRIVGRQISNWIGATNVDSQVLISRLKKEGRVSNFATVARNENGGSVEVSIAASLSQSFGDTRFVLLVSRSSRPELKAPDQAFGAETDGNRISDLVGRVPMKELIRDAVDVIEKMCIEAALSQTGNNRASAADLLGLSRQSLYIKLKRYGLEDFGTDD